MPARKNQINLLPEKQFEASSWGRVLSWLLGSFRVIVIATELVVMLAFLSRFWLDARNSDLGDKIKQQKAVLLASQNFEKTFNDTQTKLKIFTQLTTGTLPSQTLQELASLAPPDMVFASIVQNSAGIKITGAAASEESVGQFLANLKSRNYPAAITRLAIDEFTPNEILFSVQIVPQGG